MIILALVSRSIAVVPVALLLLGPAQAAPLSLQAFFQGHLTGQGTLENFREGTKRPFTADMEARWSGSRGTLVQEIAFADGERQHRVWTFDKVGPGRFTGQREDLTRTAEVTEDGDGVRMVYKANTRVPSGSTFNLAFDDRMTPVSPTTLRVKSDISYLFLSVAEITMTITRAATK